MDNTLDELLRTGLSRDDLNRLHSLSAGRLQDLFLYDPDGGRFEPAEGDLATDDLHAVLRAADVLSSQYDRITGTGFASPPRQVRIKNELQYCFGPGETHIYERFMMLLQRDFLRDGQHVVDDGVGLDGPIVTITLVTTTEEQYQAAKEHVSWLYEVAKRHLSGVPYKGYRPY